MKSIAKALIRILPGKLFIIRLVAKFPPALKTDFLTRLCGALLFESKTVEMIETNLGIASSLKVTLPSNAPAAVLCGTPMQYRGESGPLYLSLVLSQQCDVFLDIGANLGYFTYFLRANNVQVPIHYFEPNLELFDVINNNLNSCNILNVIGHQVAVGEKEGTTKFFLNLSDPASSSLETYFTTKHETVEVEVNVTTMKKIVDEGNLSNIFAKVDVEAAEQQFLDGARSVLDRISYLVVEVLGPAHENGFVAKLIDEGFEAYYINNFSLEHSVDGSFRYIHPEYNWLFCRKKPSQLQELVDSVGFIVKQSN